MFKKLFISSLILTFFIIHQNFYFSPTFAQTTQNQNQEKNFSTTLHTTYTININGSTHVEHKFQIKNLTPTYIITKYGLQLSSKNIENVTVTSNNEKLPAEIVNTKNQTSIGINFPDKLAGQDKIREFTISYQNSDIAQISGKVLELTIPQMADSSQYDNYQVSLIVPAQFGKPSRITPENYTYKESSSHLTIHFFNPKNKGISAIFGESQVFNLSIAYHLTNPSDQAFITQIALPPDTQHQRLNYQKLDPNPRDIKIDEDGNWIATYYLPSNSTVKVEAQILANITLESNNQVPNYNYSTKHLNPQEYWEIRDSQILELVQEHNSPQKIYNFVSQNLTYTTANITDNLERLGAKKALLNPTLATCQEFTDVFVAMARSINVPARRITGYAYTRDNELRPLSLVDDILHAWPEYYSAQEKKWVPIDPTWGNTTQGVDYFNQFDLNHIVFAINGVSSVLPYPAGAYKVENLPSKNIEVDFAKEFIEAQPSFSIALNPRKILFFTIPGKYLLEISNNTGMARYNLGYNISTQKNQLLIDSPKTQIDYLLPYQVINIPISVYNIDGYLINNDLKKIDLFLENNIVESFETNVTSIPKIFQKLGNPNILLGLVMGGTFIAFATGSILIFRQKR